MTSRDAPRLTAHNLILPAAAASPLHSLHLPCSIFKMLLFGGDSSAPRSTTSQDKPTISLHARSPTPPNAQVQPLVSFALDSDEYDDLEDGDDERDTELDKEPDRANRFKGKPYTWRRHTAADRQVAASLERMESADLSAHLYNAHKLKHRVRRPVEQLRGLKDCNSKDAWLKRGEELQFTNPYGETETELVPGSHWTAWPLPPKPLPAKEKGVSRAESDEDTWYIGDSGAQEAGEVMREEALALFLRQAKEKWSLREADDSGESVEMKSRQQNARVEPEEGRARTSRSRSAGALSKAAFNMEMHDDEKVKEKTSSPSDTETVEDSDSSSGRIHVLGPRPSSSKPVFLADDDEARRILQPSVNSLLARLDHLALAVRRCRFNRFGEGAYRYSGVSGSEFTSDPELAVISKAPSRSRSKSKPVRRASARPPSARAARASKPKRKPHGYENPAFDHSDSASDYTASRGAESEAESSGSDISWPKQKRSTSTKLQQHSDSSSTPSFYRAVGKMDWSELLGIASMTGWDERAVARAAQRCASLFDEGMAFRAFDESLATRPIAEPAHYTPSPIQAPYDLGISAPAAPNRPYFDVGTRRCPHRDCRRGAEGSWEDFKKPYHVIQHVIVVHGYDPQTNDSDNEERKVGAVHRDGFLQPITAKRGWFGGGRSKAGVEKTETWTGRKRKKQKVEDKPATPFPSDDAAIMNE